MASYLTNRVSSQVSGQLPDHVRSQYETYVLFLEAYYEFMEQQLGPQEFIQNLSQYNNVDETIDGFLNYFYKTYCADFPTNPRSNKRETLKFINELYQHKGSEKAVKLLFKLLYDTSVEFYYPGIQVFKGSGGRWRDRLSIRVTGSFEQLKNLIGIRIFGVISGANAKVKDVQLISRGQSLVELFLERTSLNGNFIPYETVFADLPGQKNELFALKVYQGLLNRDPIESEIFNAKTDLDSNVKTPSQLILDVASSDECLSALDTNLEFLSALWLLAFGEAISNEDFATYSPRLTIGETRFSIANEILSIKRSIEYLSNVLRSNDTIIIRANVRPVVSNVTIVDPGYNYNVGDIVTIDTDIGGNNSLRGIVSEVKYLNRLNYDSNLANGGILSSGIVKIDLETFDTVNVTYANANLIMISNYDLSKANVIFRHESMNNMPALHANIDAGNISLSYGQRANLIAKIGAHCEYIGSWKQDPKSRVREGVISLPESQLGGMVFQGRKDDGTFEDDLNKFINDVFYYMLNRLPSTVELTIYKNIVKQKGNDNIESFFGSVIEEVGRLPAFKISTNYTLIDNLLITLYRVCLGRLPESGGAGYWTTLIKTYNSSDFIKQIVIREIANSPEALQYYKETYNTNVLLSDDVYYQPFSYEIATNESIDVWSNIVRKLVHPAGLVFFGKRAVFPAPLEAGAADEAVTDLVGAGGSIRSIRSKLDVSINVLKSMPPLAMAPAGNLTAKIKSIFSSVLDANANISYVGAGPRYETIDTWKFSTSANLDPLYSNIYSNITLDRFTADNIRSKYAVTPPLYAINAQTAPFVFSVTPSAATAEEGQVIVFTINAANVPDGTQVVYVIEESSSVANTDARTGDIGYGSWGLYESDPIVNANVFKSARPGITSGYYYVNWTNTYVYGNSVLTYCDMVGSGANSSVGGWMLIDTTLLNIYDGFMNVNLKNMYRSNTSYNANAVNGYLRTMSIPLPQGIRGVRVEFLELENVGDADGITNIAELSDVFSSANGTEVFLGTGASHFGVSIHNANNSSNAYISLPTLRTNLSNVSVPGLFFGKTGQGTRRANANAVYFTQSDDVGFNVDKIVISQSDSSEEFINLKNIRIWIK